MPISIDANSRTAKSAAAKSETANSITAKGPANRRAPSPTCYADTRRNLRLNVLRFALVVETLRTTHHASRHTQPTPTQRYRHPGSGLLRHWAFSGAARFHLIYRGFAPLPAIPHGLKTIAAIT
jgi:hypothetical protein